MAEKCGFSAFEVKFYQRFGIGNLIAWLQTREPRGEAMYDFVTRVCGIDVKKFKDGQGRYIEKDITIENPDNMLSFGNGRIVNGYYVMQPVKTRPMMPVTDIRGGEDLKKALKQQQNL